MIPSAFSFMNGFPKTVNGKIDRKALVFDAGTISRQTVTDINALLPTERIIYRIWSDVLKLDGFSVTDNFFDVGGNSLLALSLATLISKEYNIPVDTIMVFKYPTIKGQSDFLSGRIKKELTSEKSEIDEKSRQRRNVSFKKYRE
jgi:hypothetical protein